MVRRPPNGMDRASGRGGACDRALGENFDDLHGSSFPELEFDPAGHLGQVLNFAPETQIRPSVPSGTNNALSSRGRPESPQKGEMCTFPEPLDRQKSAGTGRICASSQQNRALCGHGSASYHEPTSPVRNPGPARRGMQRRRGR